MNNSRIVVLGATGMLGSAVYLYLRDRGKFEVRGTHRAVHRVPYQGELHFYDPLRDERIEKFAGRGDSVVNCIGVIKPYVNVDRSVTIYVNSVYPHRLAVECGRIGAKLIHITTDCVFSGASGSYDEDAPHDALDLYGRSKSLGEPAGCMVLRTSIVGREQHSRVSLVEWFLKQEGKEVNGFVNHWWNGITTREYARIVEHIVDRGLYIEGVRHVFSDTLTKYEMLGQFKRIFRYDDTLIHPVDAPERCNRALVTKYADLLPRLQVRPFAQMLDDLLFLPTAQKSVSGAGEILEAR